MVSFISISNYKTLIYNCPVIISLVPVCLCPSQFLDNFFRCLFWSNSYSVSTKTYLHKSYSYSSRTGLHTKRVSIQLLRVWMMQNGFLCTLQPIFCLASELVLAYNHNSQYVKWTNLIIFNSILIIEIVVVERPNLFSISKCFREVSSSRTFA